MDQSSNASAGKLHLLNLTQFKASIGDKWERLSAHVEKFFEAAIRRALGPGDTFSRLDELSYVVLFPGLSLEEAQVKCAAISEEVCQRLFGEQGTQASLRNLVAHVNLASMPVAGREKNTALDALLEREGRETIVSPPGEAKDGGRPETSAIYSRLHLRFSGDSAFRRVKSDGIEYLYRPVWDAVKQIVVTYLCQPTLSFLRAESAPHGFCVAANEDDQAALDHIVILECAEHTKRLRQDGFRILSAVPVGFSTISRSRLWSAYQESHRKIPKEIARDLAYMIIGIDRGTPNIRLAQELPKLSAITQHILCAVDDGGSAGARFSRTGARAVGLSLAAEDAELHSMQRIRKLGQETRDAGLDAFVLGIQSTSLALNAISAGIRYLEGPVVRSASADPRHAFAQSLEYLYQAKLETPTVGS